MNIVNIKEYKRIYHHDYNCQDGWTTCLERLNLESDICFFGHSMIRNHNFQDDYPTKRIITLGYAGQDIIGMISRVKQIKVVNPKIVVMAGTNSLYLSRTDFEYYYSVLINQINNSVKDAHVICIDIPLQSDGVYGESKSNSIIIERNSFIHRFCEERSIPVIMAYQMYADGNGNLDSNLQIEGDGVHIKDYSMLVSAISDTVENFY